MWKANPSSLAGKELHLWSVFHSAAPLRVRVALGIRQSMDRRILHLDIDAFLASVEQLRDPALRGKPVVVGTGVVASRSYEAKARGVATAMPLYEALRRCPDLVVRAAARAATGLSVAQGVGSTRTVARLACIPEDEVLAYENEEEVLFVSRPPFRGRGCCAGAVRLQCEYLAHSSFHRHPRPS
jgi:nucleotidyltransferase/DNA polymerase involved in DNA repair